MYSSSPLRLRPAAISLLALFPANGYPLADLGGGLYGLRYQENYQSILLIARRGVVAVDAPAGCGQALLAAIREVTEKQVTHFIYGHAHKDHTGDAHLFAGRPVAYIAHQLTAERLRRAGDPNRTLPTTTVAGRSRQLVTGGQRLVLDYRGDNHLPGNLFIHAPEQQALMLVDVVTPRWTPFFRLGLSRNVTTYIDATEQILRFDFTTFITGHAGNFGSRAEHGRYLADLQTAVGQALATFNNTAATTLVPPDNYHAQAQAFLNAVAARTAQLMPTTWLTPLGGADVFLRDKRHRGAVEHADRLAALTLSAPPNFNIRTLLYLDPGRPM